jgi:hypothetical protein
MAGAMALVAVPRPAAASTGPEVHFILTVYGPSPSGDTLALSVEQPPGGSNQIQLFCAPLSAPGPNPAGPCQGGGKTYTIILSARSYGIQGFYQFQDVDPNGGLHVLREGSFSYPAGPEADMVLIGAILGTPPTQHQCTCGTGPGFGPPLPNTAVATPAVDRREAVLPALGLLMVLLAVAVSARRRHGQLPATMGAE